MGTLLSLAVAAAVDYMSPKKQTPTEDILQKEYKTKP
jgi:hypothetical protein